MDNVEIQLFLQTIGKSVPPASRLVLVGGGALAMLGSPRLTVDIDFVGDDIHPSPLHLSIMEIAREMKIHVEPVPLDRFIPLPDGSDERSIRIGQFGNLEVFVADPYSISLSKLDRGFDTDLADIVFLVQKNHITLEELEHVTRRGLAQAGKYDFNPDILDHLQELKHRLA